MAKAKLKNVIILLLIVTNGLLLWLALPLISEKNHQQELSALQLENLFAQYDVTFDQGILPDYTPLYTAELTTDLLIQLPTIEGLLGKSGLTQTQSQPLQVYEATGGTCEVARNGDFTATLTGHEATNDMMDYAQSILDAMALDVASLSAPVRTDSGSYMVTAVQSLYGVPYATSHLDFYFVDGVLDTISGNAILGLPLFTRPDDLLCMAYEDALVAFFASRTDLGWVGSAITEISQGFALTDTASATTLRISPGWRIQTDTGDFWVDGITGAVNSF